MGVGAKAKYALYLVGHILCILVHQQGGITVLKYFQPIRRDNLTLSIDNVVIDYYISRPQNRENFCDLMEVIALQYACNLTHWESFKIGTFRGNFTIKFKDGESFWIGMGLNEAKTNWGRVRLDFNPNKVAVHSAFRKILAFLNMYSREMHTKIPRFDLAVDFPVLRENVFLVKDRRVYEERRHGSEYTQYLGKKSQVGRVKLYNKQVESKLTQPLTRLELTLDPDNKYEEINMPMVYYIKDLQMTFDDMKLTDTERFILNALLHGCGNLSQLGRKTREKMERAMTNYCEFLKIEPQDYMAILNQLREYKRYPSIPLDEHELDIDSPVLVRDYSESFVEIKNTAGLPFASRGDYCEQ